MAGARRGPPGRRDRGHAGGAPSRALSRPARRREFLRYSVWLRLFAYSLNAGWSYRRNQLMRELVAPADWAVVRLPDRLFWLFLLIRPFGWLIRRRAGKGPSR